MKKIYLIAGLTVEMTGEQMLRQVSQFPGFDIFEIPEQDRGDADICIHMDRQIDTANLMNIRLIHCFSILDLKHTFSKCEDGYLFEMYQSDGKKIISIIYNLKDNTVFTSSSDNEMIIKYAVWIAYFLPAIGKRVIPIHASSVVKDSEAVLFLGESGTGKSTHARLWLKYIENSYLLNDDSPLLCLRDGKIFVHGSPWSGKTHCYQQKAALLKAMVRLKQYPENRMNRRSRLESIGAIHPSFPPFIAHDEVLSEKVMYMIDKIVNNAPVYELRCLPDKEAAEIAYNTIY
ncbi:hypothetical protein [Dysgonomonas sp. 25]|uniref:hypothetical protein n=1 Tax=Dysgonomonas sp. 25 TaxID=2302933 RepID=UPI0013D0C3F1|nr:hypothetical protein [Dysgonomonas sp. 25]NDV67951.1 hypothetical protein [Dysgonomonas sp. 25]